MTRRALAALLIAFALLLAACGDDSGSDSQEASDQQTDGGDPSPDGDGSGVVPESDLEDYFSGDCLEAVQAFNSALASAGSAFTGGGENATLEDTADQIAAVADAAPEEISDDFGALADAYAEFAQVLVDAGIDFEDPSTFQDADALDALQSIEDIFDEEELEQASNDIEAWFDTNCG